MPTYQHIKDDTRYVSGSIGNPRNKMATSALAFFAIVGVLFEIAVGIVYIIVLAGKRITITNVDLTWAVGALTAYNLGMFLLSFVLIYAAKQNEEKSAKIPDYHPAGMGWAWLNYYTIYFMKGALIDAVVLVFFGNHVAQFTSLTINSQLIAFLGIATTYILAALILGVAVMLMRVSHFSDLLIHTDFGHRVHHSVTMVQSKLKKIGRSKSRSPQFY